MNADKKLFKILNEETQKRYKSLAKYYKGDVKPFINKISRDYEPSGKFPAHVLKQIRKIPREDYYAVVCILRGALPYSILFEAAGWKIYYVRCGRRGEHSPANRKDLIFDNRVDKSIKEIKGKKVLLIDNNSPTGNTPLRTYEELKKLYNIKKAGLFLDYFIPEKNKPRDWLKKPFWKNKTRMKKFGKIFVASDLKVSKKESPALTKEFLEVLQGVIGSS